MTTEANRAKPLPFTLRNKKWYYKSEGNANVVLAVPEDGSVLRVMKDDRGGDASAAAEETLFLRRDYCHAVRRLFFGRHADVPDVVAVPAEELREVDASLRRDRPAARAHKRLGWTAGLAAVYPDYTVLHDCGRTSTAASETAVVYCVEIKPKQGWTHRADREPSSGWCAFCAHQYLKLSRGDVPEISRYCPLDLFSGRRERIARAVCNLFRTPQNNLKVFRDGVLLGGGDHDGWFGFGDGNRFCAFVAAALLGDFDGPDEEDAPIAISPPVDEPTAISPPVDDKGTPTATGPCDFDAVPTPRHCVLHRILAMQRMQTTGFADVCSEYDELMRRPPVSQFGHVGRLTLAAAGLRSADDALSPIDGYLVAATARDCSVFLTFGGTTRVHDNVRLKVSDLDPKPLSTVHKHRERNAKVLMACATVS